MRSVAGFLLILGLAALNQRFFELYIDTTYLTWYLRNAAIIGVVTAIASMTWADMKGMTGLISANPWTYMTACTHVIGLPMLVLGTHMRTNEGGRRRSAFDSLMTIPLVLILVAVMLSWLIVVVPLQYFVYLICGAPARLFAQSTRRTIARMEKGKLEFAEIGKEDKVPDGWWDASIAGKPVTSTNLFASMIFLVSRAFLG